MAGATVTATILIGLTLLSDARKCRTVPTCWRPFSYPPEPREVASPNSQSAPHTDRDLLQYRAIVPVVLCDSCKRPFRYSEVPLQMPGTKEREDSDCPSCHATWLTEVINGYFHSDPLSAEEERAFFQRRAENN
jgi:hypothetical protein